MDLDHALDKLQLPFRVEMEQCSMEVWRARDFASTVRWANNWQVLLLMFRS